MILNELLTLADNEQGIQYFPQSRASSEVLLILNSRSRYPMWALLTWENAWSLKNNLCNCNCIFPGQDYQDNGSGEEEQSKHTSVFVLKLIVNLIKEFSDINTLNPFLYPLTRFLIHLNKI